MNYTNLSAINVFHFNGNSINLNEVCMSHTIFQSGQVLEAAIYDEMIIIRPAILPEKTNN